MKAVLMSLKPNWCDLIYKFLGYDNRRPLYQKRLDLRKSKPKCNLPFKVYIYCTQDESCVFTNRNNWIGNGKVIGEFICDYILSHCEMANADVAEQMSCVPREDVLKYSNGKEVYGWHISNLVIYNKPKELGEFHKVGYNKVHGSVYGWTLEEEKSWQITRPPQSWCYVDEASE